jgi:PAS domain-containing protein
MEGRAEKGAPEVEPCKRCAELEKAVAALKSQLAADDNELETSSRSAEILREIFQCIPSGIVVCQYQPPGELFCLFANPEAIRLTGIDSDAFAGAELDEIWPSARSQGLTQSLADTAKSGRRLAIDRAYYSNRNRHAIFRLRAVPLARYRVCVAFEDFEASKSFGAQAPQTAKEHEDRNAGEIEALRWKIRELQAEVLRLKSEQQ